jgi:hypothetical protein
MLWRMKPLIPCLAAVSLAAVLAASAAGQGAPQGRQRVDVAKLGPQVGERVPDFSLPDQTGKIRNLQSIMGPRGAMIVFYRSADW